MRISLVLASVCLWASCTRPPGAAFQMGGFHVFAEGDSGQSVTGIVTGKSATVAGLKVAAVHVIRTLAVADVQNGQFSLPLPKLVPQIDADTLSKYEKARDKLNELTPMNPIFLRGGWPYLTFDGFWLTLFVDSDGDNQFTRGIDREISPIQTYYLVFQAFSDTAVSPFAEGWYLRFMQRNGSYKRQAQLDGLTLDTH